MNHDDIIDAFKRAEPSISTCARGGDPGYTHIHSPAQPPAARRCSSHWIVVERANGTVAFRGILANKLGAAARPNLRIAAHAAGHSAGPAYGDFDHALDLDAIADRWPTVNDFVQDVLTACRSIGAW